MDKPLIAIVIPCYCEEETLPLSAAALLHLLDRLSAESSVDPRSFILAVDDGSTDGTWSAVVSFHERDRRVKGLRLAANRGHQAAIMAGLAAVNGKCDAAITIDADLQDEPAAIGTMLREFGKGAEIVFGVRERRESDSWFKRTSAHAFYRLQRRMGIKTIFDHADFRLMSARAITMLLEYGESNLYLRGIVAQLGLRTATVSYTRRPRMKGNSKYPLRKMAAFSADGISSFTAKPIRLILLTGLILLLTDAVVAVYVLFSYFAGRAVSGWASIMLSVWGLGSLMLVAIGIVGEYIGKIYIEVKHRPRYALRDRLWD